MLRLIDIHLQRGTKVLLNQANLLLTQGQRVGIVGRNGIGKSSLFSLFANRLQADQGHYDHPPKMTIAEVSQETPALSCTALDYVLQGDQRLVALQDELEELSQSTQHAQHGERIAELHALLHDIDGYSAPARAQSLLAGLGFKPGDDLRLVSEFSGGWRMRLNLAQALIAPADLLLLDEPTNHLDLDSLIWLEQWLKYYPGTLLIISHDREFLDQVITHTVHIQQQQLKLYTGNYSSFEKQAAEHAANQQAAQQKQQAEVEHLTQFINRFKAKATKAKQAQSRMKRLEKIQTIQLVSDAPAIDFNFEFKASPPNPLLTIEQANFGYDTTTVLRDISISLQTGARIGLLGVNGAGKSTFIKSLIGELPPQSGQVIHNKGLVIGYFAQHQIDTLRADDSPLQHLARIAPLEREQVLRDFLGRFHFQGEMATSSIEHFSGGERARLALALIAWQTPNLLLLDEPTNHLDLETRHALACALTSFQGALILVSHDRHLLEATVDDFWHIQQGKLTPFAGDLEDYQRWVKEQQTKESNQLATQKELSSDATTQDPTQSANRKEQRRVEAQRRQALQHQLKPLTQRLKKIEDDMAKAQTQKTALETMLADPDFYETSPQKVHSTTKELGLLNQTIETLELTWLDLQTEIDTISQLSDQ